MGELTITSWTPPQVGPTTAPAPGWLSRTFGLSDEKGFRAAINRELAQARNVDEWSRVIDEAAVSHRVARNDGRRLALTALLKAAQLLTREDFIAGGRQLLYSLAEPLPGGAATISRAFADRAAAIYREITIQAAADDQITEAEAADLQGLVGQLNLDAEEAQSIYASVLHDRIERRVKAMLDDGMFEPDEEAALEELAKSLRTNLTFDDTTQDVLDEARRAWRITHGDLPTIPAPVALQRNEVAYAAMPATASEQRSRTTSVRYGGPSVRVRIMKGVYYNAGGYSVARSTEDYEHLISSGQLIVTNKRLVFCGTSRSMSWRLDSILEIDPYGDAVVITRSSGKPTIFRFAERDPWFAAILQRARQDF